MNKKSFTCGDILSLSGIAPESQMGTPGVIVVANASRFNSANLSQPLTQFAVAQSQQNPLREVLREIVPDVPVSPRFSFQKQKEGDQFVAETGDSDVRGIGAAFKRIDFGGSEVEARTYNKGLTIRIDHDQENPDDPNTTQRAVQILDDRLMRAEVLRALGLLDSIDTNAAVVWDPAADPVVNPYTALRAAIRAGHAASGVRPNRALFAGTAWDFLNDSVEASKGAFGTMNLTKDSLRSKLALEKVAVVDEYYQAAKANKAPMLAAGVFFYFARDLVTRDDASNIKRFVSGADRTVYVNQQDKWTDVTVEHYSNIIVTASTGVRKVTPAQA